MRFINHLQVDAAGNSVPGAYPLTPEQQAAINLREIQAAGLDRVAASTLGRLEASGGNYDILEFDRFAKARGLTTRQSMEAKRLISEQGMTLNQALGKLRIT